MSSVEVLTVGGDLNGAIRVEDSTLLSKLGGESKKGGVVLVGFGREEGFWPELLGRLRDSGVDWTRIKYIDERDEELSGCKLEELIDAWSTYLRQFKSVGIHEKSGFTAVPKVDEVECSKLNHCDLCLSSCPYEAITGKPPSFDPKRCIECGLCINYCPAGLISDPNSYSAFRAFLSNLKCSNGLIVLCPKGRELLYSDVKSLGLIPYEVSCLPSFSFRHLLLSSRMGFSISFYCPESLRVKCPKNKALELYVGMLEESKKIMNVRYEFVEEPKRMERNSEDVFKNEDSWIKLSSLPFFRPVVGSECTLCGVCEKICPTTALKIKLDDKYRLMLDHSRCIGCKECEATCPEKAIVVKREANPILLKGGLVEVASSEVARCKNCGKVIGPEAMVSKIERILKEKGASKYVLDSLRLCDECKRKKELGLI